MHARLGFRVRVGSSVARGLDVDGAIARSSFKMHNSCPALLTLPVVSPLTLATVALCSDRNSASFYMISLAPPLNSSMQVAIDSGDRGFLTYEGDPLDKNLQRPDAPVGMLIMSYRNRRRYRLVIGAWCSWLLVCLVAAVLTPRECFFFRDGLTYQCGTASVLFGFTHLGRSIYQAV